MNSKSASHKIGSRSSGLGSQCSPFEIKPLKKKVNSFYNLRTWAADPNPKLEGKINPFYDLGWLDGRNIF